MFIQVYVYKQTTILKVKWKSRVLTHVPKTIHSKNLNLNLETET